MEIPSILRSAQSVSAWFEKLPNGSTALTFLNGFGYMTHEEGKELIRQLEFYISRTSNESIKEVNDSRFKSMMAINQSQNTSKNERTPGYVYLIKSGKRYKIGLSINPDKRFKDIKSANPTASLCHKIKTNDCFKLERELHVKYRSKRREKEWFVLNKNDICEIMSLTNKDY